MNIARGENGGGITVELGLYGLILALAAFLRLYALDRWPLAQEEAELAYKAWRFYWGMPGPPQGEVPFLFAGNLLSFLVFGISDYTARLVSALVGTSLVGLPYLLRRQLGRLGALVTSLLLATSPSLLFFSRYLGEEMAVAGCFLLVVAGLFGYLEGRGAKSLYITGGALALLLTAGAETYTMLFILLSFLFILPALRQFGWLREEDWEKAISSFKELKTRRALHRNALLLFGGVLLLVSMSFLSNPHGLQSTLELFPRWTSRLLAARPYPWYRYPQPLLVYELPALVLGGLGAIYLAWRKRSLLAIFSTYWFLWSFLIRSAAGPREGEGIVLMLVPLILLAGMLIGCLLEKLVRMAWSEPEGVVAGLSLAGFTYLMLWLAGYARGRQPIYWQIGPTAKLSLHTWVYIFLGLLFFVGLFVFAWRWMGRERTLTLGGGMLALFLILFSLHTGLNLNYYRGGEPVEILTSYPTSRDVVHLVEMLEELSNRMRSDRHILGMDVEKALEGILAWYLRDFPNLRFSEEVSLSPQTPVAIAGAGGSVPSEWDYISQRLHFQYFWEPKGMEMRAWWAWYLFREVQEPTQTRDIVVYVME